MKKNYNASESFITAALLTFSGGFQDAYTYFSRGGVFANAQTGNVVLMSGYFFRGDMWSAARYIIPLFAFVSGIITAESIHRLFRSRPSFHWRQLIAAFEITILFIVGTIPENLNMAANCLVSFVCAMQIQSFQKIGDNSYSSTMCIGNLRSGTNALCSFIYSGSKKDLKTASIYFGVLVVFFLGAGCGYIITSMAGVTAIRFSCLPITAALILMFFNEGSVAAEKKFIGLIKKRI